MENEELITIRQFLNSIHRYTECVRLRVINDVHDGKKAPDYLSMDIFAPREGEKKGFGEEEERRILEYYGEAHVWNVHADLHMYHGHIPKEIGNVWFTPCIEANVSFSEVRDAWYREKADIQREKRRQREKERRRARKENEA